MHQLELEDQNPSQSQPTQSPRNSGSLEAKSIRSMLGNHWVDRDPEVEALEVGRWLAELAGMTPAELIAAYSNWERTGLKTEAGRVQKPTPQDIRKRVVAARRASQPIRTHAPKVFLDKPEPEPEREPVTAEQAARIMADAGFTPDLTQALRRFPGAPTRQRVEELVEEPPVREMTCETDPKRLALARAAAEERRAKL